MLPAAGRQSHSPRLCARWNDKRSWVLSLYYFLTFGGFVAMAVYLPTLLTEVFKLTPQDAGFRTAGFVVLATGMRPVGGVLADKVGGRAILKWVFPATAVFAIFLACPLMSTFTIGALGMAAVDRSRQWRRLQAGSGVLPQIGRRRYRFGRRGGRTGRILSALGARRHQAADGHLHLRIHSAKRLCARLPLGSAARRGDA